MISVCVCVCVCVLFVRVCVCTFAKYKYVIFYCSLCKLLPLAPIEINYIF